MLQCRIFSQYEKLRFALRNLLFKLLFLNKKIYLLYKT